MATANFEEKTYETAYNVELATGSGGNPRIFAPGQVLEKLTGFDAAANPEADHLIWRVLGSSRPPGLSLVPSHWTTSPFARPERDQLPSLPVSLILQFKRPEYLHGTRAKQWNLWHRPYYRFARSKDQHQVLRKLEERLAGTAVVRYAAPAFHTLAELETAQIAGEVIARSGHVSPVALGKHRVWTYDTPGTLGRGNPSGRQQLFESFNDLFVATLLGNLQPGGALVPYDGIDQHLAALADACRFRAPRLRRTVDRWVRTLPGLGVPTDRIQPLADYAAIQTLVSWQKATWWLLDGREVNPSN